MEESTFEDLPIPSQEENEEAAGVEEGQEPVDEAGKEFAGAEATKTDGPSIFEDIFDLPAEDATQAKAKKKKRAIDFSTFVGENVVEPDGEAEEEEVNEKYDKIWNNLFLEKIALFPTLSDANERSKNLLESGTSASVGTVPWFDSEKPFAMPPSLHHMDRLLLRMREWAQETTGRSINFGSFSTTLQNKIATNPHTREFYDHRMEMIKIFNDGEWIDSAMNRLSEKLKDQEETEIAQKEKEAARITENLSGITAKAQKANPDIFVANRRPDFEEENIAPPVNQTPQPSLQERKEEALRKRAELKRFQREKEDFEAKKQEMLKKKREMLEKKQMASG